MKTVQLGISTCPNDTFTFHGLLSGRVRVPGVDLQIQLADVEQLNRGLFEGRFDICKVSAHAALVASEEVGALEVGWALGHGVGPVVLGPEALEEVRPETRVLAPGQWTTAHLLWRLFHAEAGSVEQLVFSEIMPALQAGRADLGVCIHEGRFTWKAAGLQLFEDLGARWAEHSEAPLPLGGLVARRSMDPVLRKRVQAGISESLAYARAHPEEAIQSMRKHAQEEADDVLWAHVKLYVNDWTHNLGPAGRAALATLSKLASESGLLPAGRALEVLP